MKIHSYTLGPGDHVNPVFEVACAYVDSAETLFLNECGKDKKWLYVPNWFVVHHLSVIATELFLKSFKVTVSHGPVTSPDGTGDEIHKHAFSTHEADLNSLPEAVVADLKTHLSEELFTLMQSLSKIEIARGRYPYEDVDGENRFPPSDAGRVLASDWMKLAKELKDFGKYGKPSVRN